MLSVAALCCPELLPVNASCNQEGVKLPSFTKVVTILNSQENTTFPTFPLSEESYDTLSSVAAKECSVEYAIPTKKSKTANKGVRLSAVVTEAQQFLCEGKRKTAKVNYKEVKHSDDEEYQNPDGTTEKVKASIDENTIEGVCGEYVLACLPLEKPRWVPLAYVMYKCRGRHAKARVQAKIDELRCSPESQPSGDYKKSLINDIADVKFVRYNGGNVTYKLGAASYTTTVDQLTMTEELRAFIASHAPKDPPQQQLNAKGYPVQATSRRLPGTQAIREPSKLSQQMTPADLEAAAFLASLQNRV